jgi:hypothetical protein
MRGRHVYRWGAVAVIALAGALVPLPAQASQTNASATFALLRALYRDELGLEANLGKAQTAMETFVAHVDATCPGVLAQAPQGTGLTEMTKEVMLAPLAIWTEVQRPVARRFDREIEHLRWTDRTIERHFRRLMSARRFREGLTVPDVCADAQAWAASGFKTLPKGTIDFLRALRSRLIFEPSLQERFARYESRRAKRLFHRLSALAERVERRQLNAWANAAEKLRVDIALPAEHHVTSVVVVGARNAVVGD